MAENETPAPAATAPANDAGAQPAGQGATTTPLTIEAFTAALLPEIEKRLKPAYDAARRAEAKAERAPQQFMSQIEPMRAALDEMLTRDLNDDQKARFKAERALADSQRTDPAHETEREQQEFRSEAISVLAEESISADDPAFVEAYEKYGRNAKTPAQWRLTLGRAIAEVHKTKARTAEASFAEREKKAREDERTRLRNEQRETEGVVDRGAGASSGAKKDWLSMSPEEFAKIDAAKEAERSARRMRALR